MNMQRYKNEQICPICSKHASVSTLQSSFDIIVNCSRCNEYIFDFTINYDDISTLYRLRSCLYYYLVTQKDEFSDKKIIPCFYDSSNDAYTKNSLKQFGNRFIKYISINSILHLYPEDINKKISMLMINLNNEIGYIGNHINIKTQSGDPDTQYLFFLDEKYGVETIKNQFYGIIKLIEKMNYVECYGKTFDSFCLSITHEGWQLINEYYKRYKSLTQGFIAMWFDPQMIKTREVIVKAVKDSGYNPMLIDIKEHNNQIVPEIFHEINRSEFVIADLTGNRGGVYYEAGYAEGLDKPVIICCRDDMFGDVHFDLKQKSAIIWCNEDDLYQKLIKRIEATVGKR